MILPLWFTVGFYTLLGLIIGSFLNVVIGRVPAGETLITRSHCPKCGHPIREYDNIPLISWLLLRAKCRDCRAPISWRYPAVELFTGAGFGFLAWRFTMGISNLLDVLLLFFFAVSVCLALIDFDTKRLPDSIVIPTFVVVTVGLVGWYAWNQDWRGLAVSAACGAAFFAFYFTLWWFTGGRGLGFGDVKLSPSVGAMLGVFGFGPAVAGFFAAFLISGIPLGLLMLFRVIPRRTKVAFGPFLLGGAWIGILFGGYFTDLYLSVAGLS